VLEVDLRVVRLFLHILAATVWVGGQLTLAGLVPAMRKVGEESTRALARQFDRVAWPAFGVLVATGIWNLLEVDVGSASSAYQMSLALKLCLVVVSGVSAALHRVARGRTVVLALTGAGAAVGAIGALFIGVQLHG
jgi:putative copper export protein